MRAGRCSIIINNHAFKPSGVKGDTECLGPYQPSPLCPVRTVPYGIYLTNGRCDAMRWVLCLSDGQIVDALQASGLEGSVIFTTAQLTVPGRPHVQALLPSATCPPSWQQAIEYGVHTIALDPYGTTANDVMYMAEGLPLDFDDSTPDKGAIECQHAHSGSRVQCYNPNGCID